MENEQVNFHPLKNFKYDVPSSIVVFFVALPLCLGIAQASEVPLIAGIVSGIVGGIIVGIFSGSALSVSGPAAGLVAIVLSALQTLGGFEPFLAAVLIAGILQFILGMLRAGVIGSFFPNSVIRGMLAAIGIILILKQIPHAFGYDKDYEGDESFITPTGENTFSTILHSFDEISIGATIISLVSLALLIVFERPSIKKKKIFTVFPAPLMIVILGVAINYMYIKYFPSLVIEKDHLVNLPKEGLSLTTQFNVPLWEHFQNMQVYIVAVTIALVASLETLLCIDAADKLDPYKRASSMNKELKAQGLGNFVCGFLGGLPITAVIVRSSANISSGARTKTSAVLHGIFLLICATFIPHLLNKIPIASLAAILLLIGYKLTKPSLFVKAYTEGWNQIIPFVVTILAILFTDLLIGIGIGLVVGLLFVLRQNFHSRISMTTDNDNVTILLHHDVTFVNKIYLKDVLTKIPANSSVTIDCEQATFIDHDIIETLQDFVEIAKFSNIKTKINGDLYKGEGVNKA